MSEKIPYIEMERVVTEGNTFCLGRFEYPLAYFDGRTSGYLLTHNGHVRLVTSHEEAYRALVLEGLSAEKAKRLVDRAARHRYDLDYPKSDRKIFDRLMTLLSTPDGSPFQIRQTAEVLDPLFNSAIDLVKIVEQLIDLGSDDSPADRGDLLIALSSTIESVAGLSSDIETDILEQAAKHQRAQ